MSKKSSLQLDNQLHKAVTDFKNHKTVGEVIEGMGDEDLTPTSHLFKRYGIIPIREAAIKHSKIFSNQAIECPPLSVIDVILAANREYNIMVEPIMDELKAKMQSGKHELPFLHTKTLVSLLDYLKEKLPDFFNNYVSKGERKGLGKNAFTEKEKRILKKELGFKEVNYKKTKALFDVLNALIELKIKDGKAEESDYDYMHDWAVNRCQAGIHPEDGSISKKHFEENAFGLKISNIGTATIQHLRMHFGADTFKPDQRVKEVLLYKFLELPENEYSANDLSDRQAFEMMKRIHSIVHPKNSAYTMKVLDSIFVNYGSGHFNREYPPAQNLNEVIGKLFKNLINEGVDREKLRKASGYSEVEFNKIMSFIN